MATINNTVGINGVNNFYDVQTVQNLLKNKGFSHLRVDGICGANTKKAIIEFQGNFYKHPDGIVTPGKKTLEYLNTDQRPPHPSSKSNLPPKHDDSKKTLPSSLPENHNNSSRDTSGRQDPKNMYPSDQLINMIKEAEHLNLMPYDDQKSRGGKLKGWVKGATIGYGHLISRDQFDKFKNGISEEEALTLFKQDNERMFNAVRSYVKVKLTQNEFDALVLFCFNTGPRNDCRKIGFYYSDVLKVVNGESPMDLKEAWSKIITSQGKPMRGLANRRALEYNIYTKGDYKRIDIPKKYWKDGTWRNKF